MHQNTQPTASQIQWQAAPEAPARAKPLNARTLAALPAGVKVWDDQIAYLNDALTDTRGIYSLPAKLRAQFTEQRDALLRAREWLQSKIDSKETDHG